MIKVLIVSSTPESVMSSKRVIKCTATTTALAAYRQSLIQIGDFEQLLKDLYAGSVERMMRGKAE